jgi:hypothetical protein
MKILKLAFFAIVLFAAFFSGCKKEILTAAKPTLISTSSPKTKMVLFPGKGWVPADQVHVIEPGYYLLKKNGHIFEMELATNKMVKDFGELKRPSVNNPINKLSKSVNSTAYNSISSQNNMQNSMSAYTNPNWITYANWKNPKTNPPITYFSTTWRVPGPPDSLANQSISIFSGLQDTTSYGDVLQPVLSWGPQRDAVGGNFWSINNIYATQGPTPYYYVTPSIAVSQNTAVTGIITFTGLHQPDNSYNYTSSFSGYSNSLIIKEDTDFTTDPTHELAPYIPELNLACETIEAYTFGNHFVPSFVNLYPTQDSIPMKSIKIKVDNTYPSLTNPAWTTASSQYAIPGQNTVIVSSINPFGEVDLYFHAQQPPIIRYTSPDVFSVGTTMTPLSPTNSAGTPNSYSVSPSLPTGLTLNTTTGVISGTPTTASAATNYTITAHNAAGSGTFNINITVNTIITVTFNVVTTNVNPSDFNLIVNGSNVAPSRGTAQQNQVNPITTTFPANANSIVVFQVTAGHVPTSATLQGFWGNLNGVISGNNVTFTGANLSTGQSVSLTIN